MYPIFSNMDQELRNIFLLSLKPIELFDSETLYEAMDVGRESYFLIHGILDTWYYANQVGCLFSIMFCGNFGQENNEKREKNSRVRC